MLTVPTATVATANTPQSGEGAGHRRSWCFVAHRETCGGRGCRRRDRCHRCRLFPRVICSCCGSDIGRRSFATRATVVTVVDAVATVIVGYQDRHDVLPSPMPPEFFRVRCFTCFCTRCSVYLLLLLERRTYTLCTSRIFQCCGSECPLLVLQSYKRSREARHLSPDGRMLRT